MAFGCPHADGPLVPKLRFGNPVLASSSLPIWGAGASRLGFPSLSLGNSKIVMPQLFLLI